MVIVLQKLNSKILVSNKNACMKTFLILTTLLTNSADISFIFPRTQDFTFHANGLHWSHLHEMSKPEQINCLILQNLSLPFLFH